MSVMPVTYCELLPRSGPLPNSRACPAAESSWRFRRICMTEEKIPVTAQTTAAHTQEPGSQSCATAKTLTIAIAATAINTPIHGDFATPVPITIRYPYMIPAGTKLHPA
ncbi:hypothetical protein [Actinoplanes sp. NPDC051494]|uniref:hypothetical protein n=1 Tax=Actinoplanes sp. NPDC051494 TaxID=3363907 RepID=UPI00379468D0